MFEQRDHTKDIGAEPDKNSKEEEMMLDKLDIIHYNSKVMRVLEVMDEAELKAISYNAKVMMFVETKFKAELNVISYNACEERTGEVFKQLDETEFDAIGYNACKKRTGKVSKQLDRAELNAVGYKAMLLEVLNEAEDRINDFFFNTKVLTSP